MKTVRLLAISLISLAVCAVAQQPASTSVSVAYQINPAHTGFMQTSGLTFPLKLKWMVTLKGNASYPLIIPGEVIAIDGGGGPSPSTLAAFSSSGGGLLWSQPVASGYGGWVGAAYDNGMVFADNYDVPNLSSGSMSAFNATTGALLWTTSLPGQYLFTSPPTAANGIVYTGGAGVGGTVYALQESTGAILWTGSVQNGDSSAPAIVGSGVYVSYVCPQSYRFNAQSGSLAWNFSGPCEGGGGDTAVVYQGLVYVRDALFYSTNGLTLNAATGAQVGGFNSLYAPAFGGNTVLYTEPSTLTAVDLTSGNTIWTASVTGNESFTCSPIIVNGVALAGSSAGLLRGYKLTTGQQIVQRNLGQSIYCSEYFAVPQAGMGAGQGLIVVPAGNRLFALQ